jgi:hypothetical protein
VRMGTAHDPIRWRAGERLDGTEPRPVLGDGRFDDARARFATTYFATTPYGACLERMAYFRSFEELPALLETAFDQDADPNYDFPPYLGQVTQRMLRDFVQVTAEFDPDALFIDVTSPNTHKTLMSHYGRTIFDELGIDRIDEGSFLARDRAITRRIAGDLYDLTTSPIIGLRFVSAHDTSAECWAVWERGRPAISNPALGPLSITTPAVVSAAERLGLRLST